MKLELAPIQGMTYFYYRNTHFSLIEGIDTYYCPFIDTSASQDMTKLFSDILPQNNSPHLDLVPQLLSNKAQEFIDFSQRIREMGYEEINWNIGCPYPMVTKKAKGSGILKHADLLSQFLEEVCKQVDYRLSVKMRLGMEDVSEGIEIVKRLNDYPLSEVILHGRTGKQLYKGSVDLDAFEKIYHLSKHPISYNGDIFHVSDYESIQARFPKIDTFMLGRGLLQNPFLAAEIKGIIYSENEKRLKILGLHDAVFKHYQSVLSGEKHLLDRMREFWLYTAAVFEDTSKFTKNLKKCTSISMYQNLVEDLMSKPFSR